MRFGDRLTFFAKAVNVKLDRFANVLFDLFAGFAGRDAAGKIGDVGREIVWTVFDDDCVFLHFGPRRPACLSALFSVSG